MFVSTKVLDVLIILNKAGVVRRRSKFLAESYGISSFITDNGTSLFLFSKQKNAGFKCPVDNCL